MVKKILVLSLLSVVVALSGCASPQGDASLETSLCTYSTCAKLNSCESGTTECHFPFDWSDCIRWCNAEYYPPEHPPH